MKVRIILKLKIPEWGRMVKGDIMTIYNEVFDEKVGIAFWPIDKDRWEVIAHDLFTGLKDKEGEDIYENDILDVPYNRIGNTLVIFNNGKYNICDYNLSSCTVIGNIHENKDLLK